MKEYVVSVNFAGFVGCDEEYRVFARDEDEALDAAIEEATGDLSAEIVDVEE